jgi:hypothetical protein
VLRLEVLAGQLVRLVRSAFGFAPLASAVGDGTSAVGAQSGLHP